MKHLSIFILSLIITLPIGNLNGKEALFPVEFVNNTRIANDSEVYILVKGLNVDTGESSFARFDENGKAVYVPVNKDTKSEDFSFKLSTIKKGSGAAVVYLPYLASGRIYISVGEPMRFQIDMEGDKPVIVDADGFKPRDPNYYTLYDKVEFSYIQGAGTWMNPTAVDFFSLPLRVEQSGSHVFTATGLSSPRQDLINQIKTVFSNVDRTSNHEWNKLFLTYKNQNGSETILRLMSPGKAMIPGIPGTDPFDTNYLNGTDFSWVDAVWNYYKSNEIAIDCSELKGVGHQLNDYMFIGRVVNDELVFVNRGDPQNRVVLPKPTNSIPWFAGAHGVFDATNNTPKAIIVRQLTSAFEVGILPAKNGEVVNRSFFDQKREQGKYFTENDCLPESVNGPWFDLYGMALHSFGVDQPIYAFAYDDALGQDGTLHDSNAENISKAIVTIGDLTGTEISRPFEDDRIYSVTMMVGEGSQVIYQGRAIQSGESLTGVTVPIEVELNGAQARIYLNPQMVFPNFKAADGIVVDLQSENLATVIFPGKSKN